ncbi:MAG: SpoIIE family protein phosphatase [Agathobacter sp.]|nr:SpoIIE family protein phosphatase [Agathobacter sp.]
MRGMQIFWATVCVILVLAGSYMGIRGMLEGIFYLRYSRKVRQRRYGEDEMALPNEAASRVENLSYAMEGLSDVLYVSNRNMETPMKESRYLVARQLGAFSGLIQQWNRGYRCPDESFIYKRGAFIYQAGEKGILVKDIQVMEENQRLRLEIVAVSKWNRGIPTGILLQLAEKVFGRSMRLSKDTKNILTKTPTKVVLYETLNYYVLHGVATAKKEDSVANGDSYGYFALVDGSYHICLSDGMGSGAMAREESEIIVDLIQKFTEAGFVGEQAIELMNTTMLMAGEGERFSTLDYGIIDLYTGELDLMKAGGAVSFIKRGNQVECIEAGSLPAGAAAKADIKSVKRSLSHGDFLVMITDGVIEYLHVRSPKDAMRDIIARAKGENAQGLADYIMMQVMILTGGIPKDDMTILVTGIWERE